MCRNQVRPDAGLPLAERPGGGSSSVAAAKGNRIAALENAEHIITTTTTTSTTPAASTFPPQLPQSVLKVCCRHATPTCQYARSLPLRLTKIMPVIVFSDNHTFPALTFITSQRHPRTRLAVRPCVLWRLAS